MPKIVEQKKQNKNETTKKVQQVIPPPPEPKVIVFRTFEAVVHLEVALQQLKAVGIFPGPEENANELKRLMAHAQTNTAHLLKKYQEIWGAIQK